MSSNATFLDVEDSEQRQDRIGTLLERLNTSSSSSSAPPNPLLNIGHERAPGPVEPPTELLARVQAFLPTISASNAALSKQRPEDIDIENVQEDGERYIEMNLGLGVFEAKPRSSSVSRSTSSSSDVPSSSDESNSESDSLSAHSDSEDTYSSSSYDDDSDVSDSESQSGSSINMRPVSSRPIKPLPRRVSQQAKLEV